VGVGLAVAEGVGVNVADAVAEGVAVAVGVGVTITILSVPVAVTGTGCLTVFTTVTFSAIATNDVTAISKITILVFMRISLRKLSGFLFWNY
jgi:hypothetical protein